MKRTGNMTKDSEKDDGRSEKESMETAGGPKKTPKTSQI
jgi:hypothetical protein